MKFKTAARDAAIPFVLVNMAMTMDGKIATANRAVSSFGSARDRKHLLELRATADAVMCGARTADLNRITLGPGGAEFRRLRLGRGLAEFNLRIIVSGSGSLDPHANVFKTRGSPLIVLTTSRAPIAKLDQLRAVADEVRICGRGEIDWRSTLQWLRESWNVKRLLCEGGGELNDALFRAGLASEIHLTLCPGIFGGRNAPTISDGLGAALKDAARFKLKSVRRVKDELFIVFTRSRS